MVPAPRWSAQADPHPRGGETNRICTECGRLYVQAHLHREMYHPAPPQPPCPVRHPAQMGVTPRRYLEIDLIRLAEENPMSQSSTVPQFNEAGKYYTWGGEKFYSVTTILKNALPTPHLIGWAAKCAGEYAVENIKQIYAIAQKDPVAATQLVKSAHIRLRDNAANLGRAVHHTIERWHEQGSPRLFEVRDVELTNPSCLVTAAEIQPFFAQWLRFVKDFKPRILHAEGMIINRRQKYAGTLDLIADIPCLGHSGLILLDTKTGKAIYEEIALQLNAYARAESIGRRDGSEVEMPRIAAAYGLHIRPDGYALVPVQLSDEIFTSFLYCREVFRWVEIISKTCLGPRITEAPTIPVEATR